MAITIFPISTVYNTLNKIANNTVTTAHTTTPVQHIAPGDWSNAPNINTWGYTPSHQHIGDFYITQNPFEDGQVQISGRGKYASVSVAKLNFLLEAIIDGQNEE